MAGATYRSRCHTRIKPLIRIDSIKINAHIGCRTRRADRYAGPIDVPKFPRLRDRLGLSDGAGERRLPQRE